MKVTRDNRNIVLETDSPIVIPNYKYTIDIPGLTIKVDYKEDDIPKMSKAIVLDNLIMPIIEKALKEALGP